MSEGKRGVELEQQKQALYGDLAQEALKELRKEMPPDELRGAVTLGFGPNGEHLMQLFHRAESLGGPDGIKAFGEGLQRSADPEFGDKLNKFMVTIATDQRVGRVGFLATLGKLNEASLFVSFQRDVGPSFYQEVLAPTGTLALDFVPGVGEAKMLIESISGKEMLTGRRLSTTERIAGVLPFLHSVRGVGSGVVKGVEQTGARAAGAGSRAPHWLGSSGEPETVGSAGPSAEGPHGGWHGSDTIPDVHSETLPGRPHTEPGIGPLPPRPAQPEVEPIGTKPGGWGGPDQATGRVEGLGSKPKVGRDGVVEGSPAPAGPGRVAGSSGKAAGSGELSESEWSETARAMDQLERSGKAYDEAGDSTPQYRELTRKLKDHVLAKVRRMRNEGAQAKPPDDPAR